MRVLVTGGAGFVGAITVRELLERGHEVTVLDTLEGGSRRSVDDRARFVEGSVGSPDRVRDALQGCDCVVHAAGYIDVAESVTHPDKYFENNHRAPLTLLDAMDERGVTGMVFSSTAAVYGMPSRVPIAEDDPVAPINPYGESKALFEAELAARVESGMRSLVLRYFNVAGAWPQAGLGEAHDPETHLIPRVLCAIRDGARSVDIFGNDYPTHDGTCVRDYVHVRDLAQAHALACERLFAGGPGATYNLGSSGGYTNLEVVRTCIQATGREVDVRFLERRSGDPDQLVASSERARDELGWAPQYGDLQTIVRDAWAWHRG